MADVAIVGAGLSGLCAAFDLSRAGREVVVLEASDQPGGTMRSFREGDCLFELGAHSFADNRAGTRALLRELALEGEVLRASASASKRYLLFGGELVRVPSSPVALLRTPLLSLKGRLRLVAEPLWWSKDPQRSDTLATLLDRRIGREARTVLADAVVGGIYAGSTETLGAFDAMPQFSEATRRYGSALVGLLAAGRGPGRGGLSTLRCGMGQLTETLSQKLPPEALQLNHRVRAAERRGDHWRLTAEGPGGALEIQAQQLICATAAHAASPWLGDCLPSQARQALDAIRYAPVAVVGLGVREEDVASLPHAFGFLVPPQEPARVLGCIFASRIFEGRAPAGLATFATFVGGTRQPALAGLPNDALVELAREELQRVAGRPLRVQTHFVARWPKGIPQYGVGHLAQVDTLRAAASALQLTWLGNWQGGVSLHDCIENGRAAAARLLAKEERSA